MNDDDFEDLHMRFNPTFSPSADEKYITLTSHNNQADLINQQKLLHLTANPFTYKAQVVGDFPEHIYPVEAELVLKEGAQVMFLKNDAIAKRYFNGKIGVVKTLDAEKVVVDCDGEQINVGKEVWENSKYILNRNDGKLEQETMGTFEQYPLRLAWAITIHKSQGLTFEKVMIDAGSAFSSGQVYVALSRCTSLEGIVLLSKIPSSAITSNDNVIKGQQTLTVKGSLAERFEGARQIFTQQLLEHIFSFEEIETAVGVLAYHINQHKEKLTLTMAVDGDNTANGWIENLRLHIANDKAIGLKFSGLVAQLMKEEGTIEKNELLQKRITDAANHFIPKLDGYFNHIKNHPLFTEHKEVANPINEKLNELALAIYTTNYYLLYCKNAFTITGFLHHKLKYATPKYNLSCYATNTSSAKITDTANAELYDTLRRWRDLTVKDEGLAVYMVANGDTLKEISTYLPLNKKDLLQITGFGKAKVDKYGDDIIDAVESYCNRYGIETNMMEKLANPKRERKPKSTEPKIDTKAATYDLYKKGKSIDEIAKERNFTTATVEGHLAHYIGIGELDINDFVTKEKQQAIKDTAAIHGTQSHKLLIENLPAGISYGDIKMVLSVYKDASVKE
jgi:DNA-binding CsgD family transcriptional regulator